MAERRLKNGTRSAPIWNPFRMSGFALCRSLCRICSHRIGEARRLAYECASANASTRPSPMAAILMMLQIRSWLCVIGTSDAGGKIDLGKTPQMGGQFYGHERNHEPLPLGWPGAFVLVLQLCTAYPQATGNGSGSMREHFTLHRSRLTAAVSRGQLRQGSALSNRHFDSTTAEACPTIKLRTGARG
jgi:hypothetical protein